VKPELIRAEIDNGTFEFGFKFKASGKWIYKVSKNPLTNILERGSISSAAKMQA